MSFAVRVASTLLLLAACSTGRDEGDRDTTTCPKSRQCAGACCPVGDKCTDDVCVACVPTTCAASRKNCGSLPDGCGATLACGTCTSPLSCGGGGVANVCGAGVCVPKTCADLQMECGTSDDGCGHEIDCGTCTGVNRCGGGGAPYKCGTGACTAESDRAFCQRTGFQCGAHAGFDNCDNNRNVSLCGTCGANERCDGGRCACIPEDDAEFCGRALKNCGVYTGLDRCGKTRSVTCGRCEGDETCAGGGVANVCGTPPGSPIGGRCNFGSDCRADSPACLKEHLPGGYCVQTGCTLDGSDCPSGTRCFDYGEMNICVKTCTQASQCGRPGEPYICDDDDTCWSYAYAPINAGKAGIGAPCGNDAACESNGCYAAGTAAAPTGYADGYCTTDCRPDVPASCPAGSGCLVSKCHRTCARASDCRQGYDCAGGFCVPDANLTQLGAECTPSTIASACGVGYCFTNPPAPFAYPGGYCTTEFPCTSDVQCGSSGVCRPTIAGSGTISFCEQKCSTVTECRQVYGCVNGSCRVVPTTNASKVKIGEACADDASCLLPGGIGAACATSLGGTTAPDGYCIAIGCGMSANDCGSTGTCVRIGVSPYAFCLRKCSSAAGCRAGYRCEQGGFCVPN